MPRNTHHLKTWPEYFREVLAGRKSFEVRRDDRGFQIGDVLLLREWDPSTERFTGRRIRADVTYLLAGPAFGIEAGFVAMSIRPTHILPDEEVAR